MENNVKVGLLYGFYRNMLTPRQQDCIDLYYNDDLSLSEISEELRITRQGVRDNIKRAEKQLLDIEEKLGFAEKFLNIKGSLEHIDEIINEIEASPNVASLSNDIKRKINEILTIVMEINEF